MKLGDETLQTPPGGVCTNSLFHIPSSTSKFSFLLVFDPHGIYPGIQGNTVGYTYSLPDLGETHAAEGSYMLTPHPDGSVTLAFKVLDHVIFKGFDGKVPINYQFDLVPMGSDTLCP